MSTCVSPARAMWLLTRLRLRRQLNQMQAIYNRPLSGDKRRVATGGKSRNRWLLTSFVGVAMLFSFGNLSRQSVLNLQRAAQATSTAQDAQAPIGTAASVPRAEIALPSTADVLTRAISMEFSLLLLVVILLSLGARELAQPDWDLEWLVTLPFGSATLLASRLAERTVANPTGFIMLLPMGTVLAWRAGFRWSAPLLALTVTVPLLVLAALARTLVDTGLRLSLPPSRLRNLQALLSIVSIVLLYSTLSLGMRSPLHFVLDWARDFPAWATELAPGLAVRALGAHGFFERSVFTLLLYGEVALVVCAGVGLLRHQLRNGVVAASSRESARRAPAIAGPEAPVRGRAWGTPVQRRELRLLSRDRTFLVQTLVLPVVIVVSQLIINGRWSSQTLHNLSDSTMATVAFGIAAYMLMLSAFQTLNSEAGALWLLYTVPHSLAGVLLEKARLWAVLALIYPVAVFTIGIVSTGRVDIELIGLAAVVLLGVPIYAAIAVALGVFGCDPLAQDARTKVRPTYVYLFMLLAGLYSYAILASEWWQRLVFIGPQRSAGAGVVAEGAR
jgi:ABC-2 type transport system permease protein